MDQTDNVFSAQIQKNRKQQESTYSFKARPPFIYYWETSKNPRPASLIWKIDLFDMDIQWDTAIYLAWLSLLNDLLWFSKTMPSCSIFFGLCKLKSVGLAKDTTAEISSKDDFVPWKKSANLSTSWHGIVYLLYVYIPSWELTYPSKKVTFESMVILFPRLGYVIYFHAWICLAYTYPPWTPMALVRIIDYGLYEP